MTIIAEIIGLNERLSTNDAPVWAEVIGLVFALGLAVRAQCHIISALLARRDPRYRDHDVTIASPIASIKPASAPDVAGRLLSLTAGLLLVKIAMASTGPEWASTFVLMQASIPVADIFWFPLAGQGDTQ